MPDPMQQGNPSQQLTAHKAELQDAKDAFYEKIGNYQYILDNVDGDKEVADMLLGLGAQRTGLTALTSHDVNIQLEGVRNLHLAQRVRGLESEHVRAVLKGWHEELNMRQFTAEEIANSGMITTFGVGMARGAFIDPAIGIRELFFRGEPTTGFAETLYDIVEAHDQMATQHSWASFLGRGTGIVLTAGFAEGAIASKVATAIRATESITRARTALAIGGAMLTEGGIEAAITPEYVGAGEREIQPYDITRKQAFLFGGLLGGTLDAFYAIKHAKHVGRQAFLDAIGVKTGLTPSESAVLGSVIDEAAPFTKRIRRRVITEAAEADAVGAPLKEAARAKLWGNEKVTSAARRLTDKLSELGKEGEIAQVGTIDDIVDDLATVLHGSGAGKRIGGATLAEAGRQRIVGNSVAERLAGMLEHDVGNPGLARAYTQAKIGTQLLGMEGLTEETYALARKYVKDAKAIMHGNFGFMPSREFIPEAITLDAEHAQNLVNFAKEKVMEATAANPKIDAPALLNKLDKALASGNSPQILGALNDIRGAIGMRGQMIGLDEIPEAILRNGAHATNFLEAAIRKLAPHDVEAAKRLAATLTHIQEASFAASLGDKEAIDELRTILTTMAEGTRPIESAHLGSVLTPDDITLAHGVLVQDKELFDSPLLAHWNTHTALNINAGIDLVENFIDGTANIKDFTRLRKLMEDAFNITGNTPEELLKSLRGQASWAEDEARNVVGANINRWNDAFEGLKTANAEKATAAEAERAAKIATDPEHMITVEGKAAGKTDAQIKKDIEEYWKANNPDMLDPKYRAKIKQEEEAAAREEKNLKKKEEKQTKREEFKAEKARKTAETKAAKDAETEAKRVAAETEKARTEAEAARLAAEERTRLQAVVADAPDAGTAYSRGWQNAGTENPKERVRIANRAAQIWKDDHGIVEVPNKLKPKTKEEKGLAKARELADASSDKAINDAITQVIAQAPELPEAIRAAMIQDVHAALKASTAKVKDKNLAMRLAAKVVAETRTMLRNAGATASDLIAKVPTAAVEQPGKTAVVETAEEKL